MDVESSSFLCNAAVVQSNAIMLNIKNPGSLRVLGSEVTFASSPGMDPLAMWSLAAPGGLYCGDPRGCRESVSPGT